MNSDDNKSPENNTPPDDESTPSVEVPSPPPEEKLDDASQDLDEDQQAPADALSRTPEELEEEKADESTIDADPLGSDHKPTEKKISPIKAFLRKSNLYFLIFLLLVVIAGIITTVTYLNSQKAPTEASIANQELTTDALKQLANTDASVGSSSQTLTIQGNAIIAGQTLMRGNLNVAGSFQTGGKIQGPSLTISGAANLGDAQINSLQVASNAAVQGNMTLRNLNVSGTSSFSGAMTASRITVTTLILSGNATLQVPNHISFTGPSPSRTIDASVLGHGGSASVNGSDTTGTLNINTGNSPAAGCFARITFRQVFTNNPHVIVSPIGNAAGKTQYYASRDKAGFSICTSSPAPANQAFAFDYFVTN